jgi:hypothetical protein
LFGASKEFQMKTSDNGFSVGSHFEGKDPVVRLVYDRILKAIRRIGPVNEEPKKTSIHLVNKTTLAGIATRKSYLIVTIKSDRLLTASRIHKTEQVSVRRFHHEIRVASSADVDAELIRWLEAAYALSA